MARATIERVNMQLQYFDHYRLLCIPDDASPHDIELAYRKAMDKIPRDWRGRLVARLEGKTARRFTSAYEELIDTEKRTHYDAYLARINSGPQFLLY